jgi:hypothetical protein
LRFTLLGLGALLFGISLGSGGVIGRFVAAAPKGCTTHPHSFRVTDAGGVGDPDVAEAAFVVLAFFVLAPTVAVVIGYRASNAKRQTEQFRP